MSAGSRVLVACLAGLLFSVTGISADDSARAASPARTDDDGDPLPEGALLRIGTARFRTADFQTVLLQATPDGKRLITVGLEGNIRIWDTTSGRQIRKINPADKSLYFGDSCVSRVGNTGALAMNGQIRLVDLATGKRVDLQPFGPGQDYHAARVSLSADGETLACAAASARGEWRVALCDATTGKSVSSITGLKRPVLSASFVPGRTELMYADEQAVHFWDFRANREIRRLTIEASAAIWRVALSPEARLLAVAKGQLANPNLGKQYVLWDPATGKELRPLDTDSAIVLTLAFSPDGKYLAASGNRDIRVWEVATGKLQRRFSIRNFALHLLFMPDCRTLFYTSFDQTIHRYDFVSDRGTKQAAHEAAISTVAFSPNGKIIATATPRGRKTNLWSAETGTFQRELPGPEYGDPCFAFVANGRQIVTARDNSVELRDVATGKELRRLPLGGPYTPENGLYGRGALAIGSGLEANQVLVCATDRNVGRESSVSAFSWDRTTGNSTQYPLFGTMPSYQLGYAAFFPDGTLIVGPGPTITDTASGKTVLSLNVAMGRSARPVLSAHGNLLTMLPRAQPVHMAQPQAISTYELLTGGRVRDFKAPWGATAAAFSPDGRILASGNAEAIQLWDMASGQLLGLRSCPDGRVTALAFSPNGRLLASGLQNTTVLLWDVSAEASLAERGLQKSPPANVASAWSDLLLQDAAKGQAAVWAFVAAGEKAVAVLKQHLHPAHAPDPHDVAQLMGRLDHPNFATREAAFNTLKNMGDTVLPALHAALQKDPPAEARQRLESLLTPRLIRTPETLRTLRAIQALETLGTPTCRELLGELASGHPTARETLAARGALHRLEERSR